jgi:hypothetical protein
MSFATVEILRIFRVPLALVTCVLAISAQRPTAAGERFSVATTDSGRGAFLHPINRGGREVEIVKREPAAPAVGAQELATVQRACVPYLRPWLVCQRIGSHLEFHELARGPFGPFHVEWRSR